ncbi:MAG: MFS transporter [Pseudomonadota bacterium]
MNHTITSDKLSVPNQPAAWGPVFAVALGTFVLVASEFMPVSLLTPIALDLGITEGQAGLSIGISGAFALFTSLFIARLAGSLDRKLLLLGLTLLMILSGSLAAFAPSYFWFMAGRALIGVAIGGFWAMSAATAMRLVPIHKVPLALAIVNGGNALATVVAPPLGSYLGGIVGWRGAFLCLVPVAAIALVWKLVSLPPMPAAQGQAPANVLNLLKRPPVALGMAAVSLFFMGQFALFTYLRPFLEQVTGVNVSTLSMILLVIGLAGFAGTTLIGRLLHQHLYRTLIGIPVVMALIAVALIAFGRVLPVTAVLRGIWGLVGTAAPVAWWTWVAKTLPKDAVGGETLGSVQADRTSKNN